MSPGLLLALAIGAADQDSCPQVKIKLIRYLEDYSTYRPPECHRSFLRALKFLPLGSESHVSLGGQLRLRWERFENERLGRVPPDDNGQLLLRAYAHSDIHLSKDWRVFAQLRTATVFDREADRSPLDRDTLDLHQLFVGGKFPVAGGQLLVRVGRQEVARDFRLVSIREWPNIRLAFDGTLLSWSNGMLSVDMYGALPVASSEGAFDDFLVDPLQAVYGLHAVLHPKRFIDGASLFFVGFFDESSRFVTQVQGSEQRQSIGTHVWFSEGILRGAIEAILQFGRAEDLDIFAWLFAAEAGVDITLLRGTLRFRTMLEIGSGDDDPSDDTLGSFNAFYPNNRYFGGTAIVGAFSNTVHLINTIAFNRAPIRASVELEQFWRESTNDVVYGPSGFPSIVSPESKSAFVGHQIDVQIGLAIVDNIDILLRLAHFVAGDFAAHTPASQDTTYVATQLRLVL